MFGDLYLTRHAFTGWVRKKVLTDSGPAAVTDC